MDLIITILPVVTKDLPISPRFTPYNFLSRCKFSTLTTRQPMVEIYLLTFPRFPLRKKEHRSYFGKNRTHDFRTSRCAGYLLDHSGDEAAEQGKPILPCARSRLRIWSRETGSAVPSRVSLLIFHTQAESGAYSEYSSRFTRRRPFTYTAIRHRVSPEFIGSHNCVPMAFTAESPPAHGK